MANLGQAVVFWGQNSHLKGPWRGPKWTAKKWNWALKQVASGIKHRQATRIYHLFWHLDLRFHPVFSWSKKNRIVLWKIYGRTRNIPKRQRRTFRSTAKAISQKDPKAQRPEISVTWRWLCSGFLSVLAMSNPKDTSKPETQLFLGTFFLVLNVGNEGMIHKYS